jgi:glycosyltransferase involved in cell wall biosynthesis
MYDYMSTKVVYMTKKKILMLSDHALSTSGVGCQSRFLIEGLLQKGGWSVRQFGAAVKHADYRNVVVNEDFIIKPIDGFGNPDLIRQTLATEKPDLLLIFTDPRFFIWLWEMEDEIHQVCPIAYWHVWDNYPAPEYNKVLYESTDLINCHSYLTYEMVSQWFPEKTNFVPHSLPEQLFYPLPDKEKLQIRRETVGPEREDHFIAFWVNRNAKRKRPNDLIWAWKIFMDRLLEEEGHQKASLVLHTDPNDQEGPNLFAVTDMLGIKESVIFSNQRVEFDHMNRLHNMSDVCVNVSYAEGFGLPTLEAMQTETPIIAVKTGGLTRQAVDHRDGSENGVALDVEFKSLVGSQQVPYIYEDYVSPETIADSFMKMYRMGPEKRKELGKKAREYVLSEFSHQKTIDLWHDSLTDLVDNWRTRHESWICKTF